MAASRANIFRFVAVVTFGVCVLASFTEYKMRRVKDIHACHETKTLVSTNSVKVKNKWYCPSACNGGNFAYNTAAKICICGYYPNNHPDIQQYVRIGRATGITGRIRLVRKVNDTSGNVEVYDPSLGWGSVCDDIWNTINAGIACRDLGYCYKGAVPITSSTLGQNISQYIMDDVNCTGTEPNLHSCRHIAGQTLHNCNPTEMAGVKCRVE